MPLPKSLPSKDELEKSFSYDRETGLLYWRARDDRRPQWNGRFAGQRAGGPSPSHGRIVVNLGRRLVLAHRVIWKMVHGEDPPLDIDHIDGDPTNNRLSNLRLATKHQNLRNAKRHRGKALPKGVTLDKKRGNYRANIYIAGRQRHLGNFDDPAQAHAAYCAAAREHFGEFARAA